MVSRVLRGLDPGVGRTTPVSGGTGGNEEKVRVESGESVGGGSEGKVRCLLPVLRGSALVCRCVSVSGLLWTGSRVGSRGWEGWAPTIGRPTHCQDEDRGGGGSTHWNSFNEGETLGVREVGIVPIIVSNYYPYISSCYNLQELCTYNLLYFTYSWVVECMYNDLGKKRER